MSGPPARRPSPAVYRRRRLVVALALILVAAAIVLAVWQPWRASGDGSAPQETASLPAPAPSSSSAAPSDDPSAEPTEPTEPTAEGAPTPEATPEVSETISVCNSGEVTVTAKTDKPSYGSGEKPKLSITLVNTGERPCVMNVGTATQTFTIESGPDTWWRSTDCQSESSDQVVQLDAGASVSSVTPLTWDRTRSSVDTCSGDRPRALPGYYNLTVAIGGIDSEPAQFRLR